ncbi:Branched-chain-amino-acid aminotransferase [Rickettsiales bacterium Ac37b]|nr:Branched-chain-amino-acid aminotransferase [Rickettsiales bacterium Ac37b]
MSIMTTLSFDDRDGFIWYNGKFVPWREAKIHVLTHGLHYASCVFEGIRSYDYKIFKLHEHNQRLHDSAELLGFKIPYKVEQLNRITQELVNLQNIANSYIRSFAWRGSETMKAAAKNSSIHVAIACWQSQNDYYQNNQKGSRLIISDWVRPPANSMPTNSKSSGMYMISTLSKLKAEELGYDDALLLDYRGYVAEASVANFFMVRDNVLYTPIADCFLNGITRQTIMELASQRNIQVIEKHLILEEVKQADEVFLTGTAVGITPVIQINDYHFNIGSITQSLISSYHDLVYSKEAQNV